MKYALLAIALLIPTMSHADLLDNGDFEATWDEANVTRGGPGYIYQPHIDNERLGWTFDNESGLSQSGTAWHGVAPDGGQYAFIQRDHSSIYQQFTLSQDSALALDFLWASRPQYDFGQHLQVTLRRGHDIYTLADFAVDTRTWTEQSLNLGNVDAGIYTLRFSGYNNTDSDVAAFIDNVSLTQGAYNASLGDMSAMFAHNVPSPVHLWMLSLVGAFFFRRKRK